MMEDVEIKATRLDIASIKCC